MSLTFVHAQLWQLDCGCNVRSSIRFTDLAMRGQLTNIPTHTLIDMLYIILAAEVGITARDAAEIEEIQRELQRRGGAQNWSIGAIN